MQYEYNFEWGVEGEWQEKRTTSEEAMVITNLAYIWIEWLPDRKAAFQDFRATASRTGSMLPSLVSWSYYSFHSDCFFIAFLTV